MEGGGWQADKIKIVEVSHQACSGYGRFVSCFNFSSVVPFSVSVLDSRRALSCSASFSGVRTDAAAIPSLCFTKRRKRCLFVRVHHNFSGKSATDIHSFSRVVS